MDDNDVDTKISTDISKNTVVVLGDGRCLFRCISVFLYKTLQVARRDGTGEVVDPNIHTDETLKADLLRNAVCTVLREHHSNISEKAANLPYLLDNNTGYAYKSIDERIDAMARPKTFAGNLELVALSFLMRIQIHLYRRSNDDVELVARIPTSLFAGNKPICLEYKVKNEIGHFNLLIGSYAAESSNDGGSFGTDLKHSVHDVLFRRLHNSSQRDREIKFIQVLDDHDGSNLAAVEMKRSTFDDCESNVDQAEQVNSIVINEYVQPTITESRSITIETNDLQTDSELVKPASILNFPKPQFERMKVDNDVGCLINSTMSNEEIQVQVSGLTQARKYELVFNHWMPSTHYIFPSIFMNGCNRSFAHHWFKKYPWLVYSQHLDGVFCIKCAILATDRQSKGALVNRPFTRWTKLSETLKIHNGQESHNKAVQNADALKNFIEKPESRISFMIDSEKQQNIERNRHILEGITRAILYCGRQCIALRGTEETSDGSGKSNPGNFLALLREFGHYDPVILQHLIHPQKQNATYLSADIQNEIIKIIGDTIRQKILDEVTAAKFFTVMADEAESHNKEIMPLCVRFVDESDNIREEFLEFCSLKRITGEVIAKEIKNKCAQFNLNLDNLRGQCYDGASSMSGSKNGVQAIILRDAPKAAYVHCNSHCLNLVIANSSSITEIDNTLKQMKEVNIFFNYSPKREELLRLILTKAIPDADRRRPLLQICETRWAARQDSYRHFYQAFTFIVTSLEVIAHNMHDDLLIDTEFHSSKCVWDKTSKSTAASLYHAITSFDFIVTFLVVYMTLDYMDGLSKKLQQRSLDIIKAYQMVSETVHHIKN